MLQDMGSNLAIIKQSKIIPLKRKVNMLTVYLDQIELVFFVDIANSSPAEIKEAQKLFAQIQRCLNYLLTANDNLFTS